jgi:hypothetical protein
MISDCQLHHFARILPVDVMWTKILRTRSEGKMNLQGCAERKGLNMTRMLLGFAFVILVSTLRAGDLAATPEKAEAKTVSPHDSGNAAPHRQARAAASGSEKILKEFTEKEFLELVPRQSPRSGQRCPTEERPLSRLTRWTWNPHRPNEIRWGSFVFPDPKFVCKNEKVEVLSGKMVEVPYLETPYGRSYIKAQIDYQKREELRKLLGTLAKDYSLTHDERFARRIALALDLWATCLPDYFMTIGRNNNTLIGPAEAAKINWDVQRASDHNGLAHEWSDVEVDAFKAIWDSKSLRDLSASSGYDVRAHIAKDYFENEGDFLTKRVPVETAIKSNLSWPFEVLADTAILLGRPDYIEWLNLYLKKTLAANFLRDGMFPESFTYHNIYAPTNLKIAEGVAKYFESHKADTAPLRIVKMNSEHHLNTLLRSTRVHRSVALPNGDLPPFDDTLFGGGIIRETTRSALLPAYGHAMLGDGEASRQTQLNVHFNDHYNHIHGAALAFSLYAFGEELLGNNRYTHGFGRYFTTRTMAYNTVTIDRMSQERSNVGMPGNAGHLFTDGSLITYEPALAGIALAHVDGGRAYLNIADCRYERMLVLNTVDADHPYVLDFFRVGGGRTHDYFIHGAITFPESAEASFPLEAIKKDYPLLEAGEGFGRGRLENKGDRMSWYGVFREMSVGRSPSKWNVTFRGDSGKTGLRVHVVDDGNDYIYLGKSPVDHRKSDTLEQATIFNGWRPSLLVRRQASEGQSLQSLFVSVIEPLNGASAISKVERLPLEQADTESVAVRITFLDGREDLGIVNLSDPSRTLMSTDKTISLCGRFGMVSKRGGASKAWLIAGKELSFNGKKLTMPNAVLAGVVNGVSRRRDGAAVDAFLTDTPLPEGTVLGGRYLSLSYGTYKVVPDKDGSLPLGIKEQGGIRQMYQIDHVERRDGKTWICLTEDPALTIKGGMATEEMRPNRRFDGPARFEITLSKHVK